MWISVGVEMVRRRMEVGYIVVMGFVCEFFVVIFCKRIY